MVAVAKVLYIVGTVGQLLNKQVKPKWRIVIHISYSTHTIHNATLINPFTAKYLNVYVVLSAEYFNK